MYKVYEVMDEARIYKGVARTLEGAVKLVGGTRAGDIEPTDRDGQASDGRPLPAVAIAHPLWEHRMDVGEPGVGREVLVGLAHPTTEDDPWVKLVSSLGRARD